MTLLRIAGVPLRLHGSLLLLVLVGLPVTWWTGGGRAAAQVAELLLLLGFSVVVHEYGHVLVARRYGLATRSVTLTPVGGLAEIEARRVPPGVDLRIALAGPTANLLLACLGLGVWLVSGLQVALWIGGANLLLGVLNLVPAFPMDGGRVLRALLVRPLGAARASTIALVVGVVFAVLFAIAGVRLGEAGLLALAVFMVVLQWREHRVQAILRRLPEPS